MIPGTPAYEELARLIREAMTAQYLHGQADGRDTYGTPVGEMRAVWDRARVAQREAADTAVMKVWGAFHRLGGERAVRAFSGQPLVAAESSVPDGQV